VLNDGQSPLNNFEPRIFKLGYIVPRDSLLDEFDNGHGPMKTKVTDLENLNCYISKSVVSRCLHFTYTVAYRCSCKVLTDGHGSLNTKVKL
jgi:hypothetical protein